MVHSGVTLRSVGRRRRRRCQGRRRRHQGRRRQRRRCRRRLSIVRAVGSADADTSAATVAPWLLVCTRTRYRHVRTLVLLPVTYVHVGCVPKNTPKIRTFLEGKTRTQWA